MVELTHRNTRRYGGYLVHMGIVLMFVGFTGAAFNQNTKKELGPGGILAARPLHDEAAGDRERRESRTTAGPRWMLERSKNGEDLGMLEPERRFYIASNQPTSEVAIRRRLNEDLYVNFAGISDDGKRGGDAGVTCFRW